MTISVFDEGDPWSEVQNVVVNRCRVTLSWIGDLVLRVSNDYPMGQLSKYPFAMHVLAN